jgi:predicted ATPase/DNA-binding winged helix-turn-helix (wHTH) protein
MSSPETRMRFQFGGFILDLSRGSLTNHGREVALRPKSFAVLCYLLERAGRLVSKDELVEAVWPGIFVGDDALARCISDIRAALGDGDQSIVKTVPRRGYLIAASVSSSIDAEMVEPPTSLSPPAAPAVTAPGAGAPPSTVAMMVHHATIRTAVLVDLVGYGQIASILEQSLSTSATAQLNQGIQELIDRGLARAGAARSTNVVMTTGDGALLLFEEPETALSFAAALQAESRVHNATRPEAIAKRVFRIGIGTGEITVDPAAEGSAGVAGMVIVRAQRMEERAVPGGALIDEPTWTASPPAARATYAGPESIKGKRDEAFIGYRALLNPDGPHDATPFEAAVRPATNLLRQLGALIGRRAELAELESIVRRNRLVTVTGSSGIGKTRLAIELGRDLLPQFPDGVWLIDLAPLSAPALVASATATVLGVALRDAETPAETIARALGDQRKLLFFDNCEHLVAAAAALIQELLERAPGISILATSQEILGIPAEKVYRLDPLAVPPADATDIAGYAAVAFFIERASALDLHFQLDRANAAGVGEICRRLDGIPLALEMAASRLSLLGVEGLRARLGDRLHMLSTSLRTSETRHRTLRTMVAWSYGLLEASDQRVFRCLGVFAGSFSLDAAIIVAGGGTADVWGIVDALGRLVDKSLITIETGARPRYRLLESLRLYAADELRASGESEALAERHAEYFMDLLERAYEAWETTPDAEWLAVYRAEIDNVRSALDWAFREPERSVIVIKLAGSGALLWDQLFLHAEGRHQIDRAGELIGPTTPPVAAARLLRQIGVLWHSSDRLRALPPLERSAALYRALDDRPSLGSVLGTIGAIYTFLGRHAEAEAALHEARDILSGTNRRKSLFNVMNNLGVLSQFMDQTAAARGYYLQARDLAITLQASDRETQILMNLAEADFSLGNIDRAVRAGREAVVRLRSAGNRPDLGWALVNLASYMLAQDDPSAARGVAAEALGLVRSEGGFIVRICLQQWALLCCIEDQNEDAARLVGFVDEGFRAAGESRQPTEQQIYDRLMNLLRTALPASDLDDLAGQGARWSEQEAVTFVADEIALRVARNERSRDHLPRSNPA